MSANEALIVWAGATIVIAMTAGEPRRARIGAAIALLLMTIPGVVEGSALVRAAMTGPFIMLLVRSIDLAVDPPAWNWRRRLFHLCMLLDSRQFARQNPHVVWRALLPLALGVCAFGAGASLVAQFSGNGAAIFGRGLGGGLILFGAFEAVTALFVLALTASGIAAPRFSNAPYRAVSLQDFWARRWNRVISSALHERVFVPLRRRGTALALTVAFTASAIVHAYQATVALGGLAAVSMAMFFVLQPPLMLIERRLDVRRWPAAAGFLWTFGLLFVLAPLLIEPVLPILQGD